MEDLKRILINAGLDTNKVLTESQQINEFDMPLDHAQFVITASRDWLDRKRQLQDFDITGDEEADYQRYEKVQEEMAYIRKLLEEHMRMHDYSSVNEMFQAAKQMVLQNQSTESVSEFDDEDDDGPGPTYMVAEPQKYEPRDLVEILGTRRGDAVAEQLANLMGYSYRWGQWGGQDNPQPLEEQNSNALKYIAEFLHDRGESEMAQEIEAYLDQMQYGESLGEEYEEYIKEQDFDNFERKLEEFGVGRYDPRSNKTTDVGPDTLRNSAAKLGHRVDRGGIPPRISKKTN